MAKVEKKMLSVGRMQSNQNCLVGVHISKTTLKHSIQVSIRREGSKPELTSQIWWCPVFIQLRMVLRVEYLIQRSFGSQSLTYLLCGSLWSLPTCILELNVTIDSTIPVQQKYVQYMPQKTSSGKFQ